MKTLHTLVFFRSDLSEQNKNMPFDQISAVMFPFQHTGIRLNEDIILFIDDDKSTKIIKNRYGKHDN